MKQLNNNKGMTLVEIIAATILLTIITTFFSVFFMNAMMWSLKTNKDTTAIAAARRVADNAMISGVVTSVGTAGTTEKDIEIVVTTNDVSAVISWGGAPAGPGATSNHNVEENLIDLVRNSPNAPETEPVMQYNGATDAGRDISYKLYTPKN